MRRYGIVLAVWLCGTGVCLAQQGPQGELQGFYQRIQTFKMRSGGGEGSYFADYNKATNGGGFGFVYNITDRFGMYQQTGFLGGAKDQDLTMRLITEFQGMRVTKNAKGIDFFAKGGVGFARYVLQQSGSQLGVYYNVAFQYGGGAEIDIGRGMFLLLEVTGLSMGVPELYFTDDRSKWCNTLMITPGIAIRF